MKRIVPASIILALTFVWLVALTAAEPFRAACDAMDRAFGAPPAWTHVNDMVRDPLTQEVSHGDAPLASFRILANCWAAHRGAERIMLMGNSQTLMASLAAGEPPPTGPEMTYTDRIAEHFRKAGSRQLFYRLAAASLTYQEMLWYAAYLAGHPEIRPDVLLVQLNYQSFATGGIRTGMTELLSDPAFRQRAEAISLAGRPDSDSFAKAISEYDQAQSKRGERKTGEGPNRGYRLETAFRDELGRIPGFKRHDLMRVSFEAMLWRCRIYLLRLGSASKRSLSGSRVDASRAALEDLVDLCSRSGIRVILFQAPTNPAVSLYATTEDDRNYHAFARDLASRYGLQVLDFEHSIPAANWGVALYDPDPLHLGREGHRRLAELMIGALERS